MSQEKQYLKLAQRKFLNPSMLGLLAFGALGGGTWLKRKRKQLAAKVSIQKSC